MSLYIGVFVFAGIGFDFLLKQQTLIATLSHPPRSKMTSVLAFFNNSWPVSRIVRNLWSCHHHCFMCYQAAKWSRRQVYTIVLVSSLSISVHWLRYCFPYPTFVTIHASIIYNSQLRKHCEILTDFIKLTVVSTLVFISANGMHRNIGQREPCTVSITSYMLRAHWCCTALFQFSGYSPLNIILKWWAKAGFQESHSEWWE